MHVRKASSFPAIRWHAAVGLPSVTESDTAHKEDREPLTQIKKIHVEQNNGKNVLISDQ